MHVALAGDTDDPAFAPEPFTPADWRELSAAISESLSHVLTMLRAAPSGDLRADVERLLAAESRSLRTRIAATFAAAQARPPP